MAAEMMNSSELRELNKERQTGVSVEDNPPVPKVKNYGYGSVGNALLQGARSGSVDNGTQSYTREAAEAGWGESRYDSNNWYAPGIDLEQSRAFEQSSFAKVGNGLIKGGITAAATAANTVLGTALGLGKFFWEYMPVANGFNPENAPDFMETLDASVNNNISKWTTDLQKKSEEWFPNYRTEQERSEQYQKEWYKHMGTANFIGDSFLKNFGFTVGAMGGGMVWSKLLGASMSKQLANDILKGSVIAAEGDAEANATLQKVAEAVRNGTVEAIDANKLAVNVKEAARRINKADALLQIYGATIGAMGEGNMEGLMAKQEFLDDYLQQLNDDFIQDYKNAEVQVLQDGKERGNEWIDYIVGPNGKPDAILSNRGRLEVQRRRDELQEQLEENRKQANTEGDRLASTTFLLNLPILTTSNLIQFGRMFSGGWKTARGNAAKVKGGIETKLPERGTPKFEADYRSGVGRVGWNSVWNTLKVMGSESFEEMAQGTVSSGAKQVAKGNMATFNNDGYDPDSIEQVRDWFSNMYEGGAEYLGDVKNWQEGALGALTGLFGIPGKVWKKGQRWNGGIPGAISDARERVSASESAAEKLNTLVNSKAFQDRWHGYIRHLKYDTQMQDAVNNDDPYAWHSANDAQLINDVMMFADAGKLEDLSQIVDAYGSLSVQDAKSLKDAMKDNKDSVSNPVRDIRNMDDATVVSKVKEQADDIKKTITQYKDIYDALSARAPIGTSPELLKELVFTSLQIKKYEDRFLKMLDETLTEVEPLIDMISDFRQSGEHITDANEKKQRLSEVRTMYQNVLGKVNLPINIPKFVEDAVEKQLDILEGYAEGNEALQKKIQDMRKLSADRKSYYRKLKTLQGDAAERTFQDQAITQEKGDAEAINQMNDIETEGLDTFEAVKKAYLEKNAKDKIEFAKTLASAEARNPAIKQFMNMKRRHDGFRAYTEKNGFNSPNVAVTPTMLFGAMNDLLRNSNSEQELINMPDSVFMPLDEFKNTYSGLIPVSDGVYESMKQAMRDTMRQYLNAENQTGSRNTLSPTPVQAPQPAITPTGYDAAQPASAAPAPVAGATQSPAPTPASVPTFTPGEEKPMSESLGLTEMAENPTPETLSQEAERLDDKAEVPGESKMVSGMIPYYRTSIPEISTEQVSKVRNGEIDRKDADFSDFISRDEGKSYTELWNALKDAGAFETVATQLNVNDEIELVIDPAFPKYEGQYQILVTTMKNGQRKVLTILSGQNSKYFGLSSLRSEIDSEYRKFVNAHPNETFVFSKKSKVWAKRAGQIDYDYSGEEKGIRDILGYDASAPIVFINRNGDAQVVRGDENTLRKVSPNTFTSAFNSQHKGALYYMSPNGDDAYIPIRLNVEHFTPETAGSTNPLFVKARGLISSIAEQTAAANRVGTNYEDENRKLRNKLTELVKLLDLHDLYLEIGNYTNIGPALKIVTWVKQEDGTRKEEHSYRTSDQITPDWLIDKIAQMEVSFQIRQKEEGGTIDQLDDYIVNGIITSNAKMLRAKGVDFYFNAWDDESKSFKPMIAEQVKAEETPAAPQQSSEMGMPPIPEALRGAVIGYSNRDDDDWFADDAEPAPERISPQETPAIPGISLTPVNDWQNLAEEQRSKLAEKGWTEAEFNTVSPEEQEIALRC